jgi:3-oxoadipate enol-lactonase
MSSSRRAQAVRRNSLPCSYGIDQNANRRASIKERESIALKPAVTLSGPAGSMPSTNLNGVDIYFEVRGSGPRLLFLNGTGATLAATSHFSSVFADTFEVAAFDQRGLGRSSPVDQQYSMSDLAYDALRLADHLGWQQFLLAGISFGGMVAQEVAVTAPDRVDRLALLCTSSGGDGGSSFPLQTLPKMSPVDRALISAEILDTRFTPEWLQSHDEDRALAGLMGQHFEVERSASVRRGEALQLVARSTHDVFERLPLITCSTLVASGRYDGIAPPENGAAIASQIPNATLELFEGGHIFFLQDPRAFPAVIAFLNAD